MRAENLMNKFSVLIKGTLEGSLTHFCHVRTQQEAIYGPGSKLRPDTESANELSFTQYLRKCEK